MTQDNLASIREVRLMLEQATAILDRVTQEELIKPEPEIVSEAEALNETPDPTQD